MISNKNSRLEKYHLYSRASPGQWPHHGTLLAGTWEKNKCTQQKRPATWDLHYAKEEKTYPINPINTARNLKVTKTLIR